MLMISTPDDFDRLVCRQTVLMFQQRGFRDRRYAGFKPPRVGADMFFSRVATHRHRHGRALASEAVTPAAPGLCPTHRGAQPLLGGHQAAEAVNQPVP